jgi:hypothetical protein
LGCLVTATIIAQEKLPENNAAIALTGMWHTDEAATALCQMKAAPCVGLSKTTDGAPLTMALFVRGINLTGSVTDLGPFNTFVIEEGRVVPNAGDGKPIETRFEFATYRNVGNVKVATNYKGRLVNPTTIEMQRFTPSGRPVDLKPDGSPQILVFRRVKDPQ